MVAGLWILAILSLASLGLAYRARVAIQTTKLSRERLRALYLCKAMLMRAIMELERDRNEFDSRNESWCRHESFDNEGWLTGIGLDAGEGIEADYAVWDECGKLNVNAHSANYLWNLATLDSDHAAAVLDWIDPDDVTIPGGAESDHYSRLRPSYKARNGRVYALDELLAVKGITAELFLGAERHASASGRSDENLGEAFASGLRAMLTVQGDGAVNLNTAPEQVLAAISGISEHAAKAVADRARGPDGVLGTRDDDPFKNLDELSTVYGMTEYESAVLKSTCKVTSDVFSILCRARMRAGEVTKTVRAVVVRDQESGRVRITAWREN